MTRYGLALFVLGLLSIAEGRIRLVEKGLKVPVLGWFLWPYRLMDLTGIGGGHRRYLQLTGWVFLGIGALITVRSFFEK